MSVIQGRYMLTPPSLNDQAVEDLLLDSRGNLKATVGDVNGQANTVNLGNDSFGQGNRALAMASFPFLYNGGASFDRLRGPIVFKDVVAVAVVAGTPQTIWTPAAGKKFRLMGWSLDLSVAGRIILVDQATVMFRIGARAAGISSEVPPSIGNGILSAVANNILKADVSANGTINGFVFGTEE